MSLSWRQLAGLEPPAVQLLAPSVSKFGPMGVRDFELFDLPYMFPSKEVLFRVTDGPVGAGLFRKLESKGITGLAYWDNGFHIMSANKPLHSVADFKGLKARVPGAAPLHVEPVSR